MGRKSAQKGVMIVDDDPSRRKKLFEVVRLVGVNVFSAVNGAEALGHIPREQPDLIIVNLDSDKTGGIEFVRRLRTYGMGQKVKVLGIVGKDEKKRQAASAVGADELLEQDTPPNQMVEIVGKYLGIKKIQIPSS